jgi:DNA-binding MarR family transcriptional regulator
MSSDKKGPRLPALLRLTLQQLTQRLTGWLAESGFDDLQPAHTAALQPLADRPDGVRLTGLAETAHVTKQTMGALVDHLEHAGYVERVEDPDDGRASRIRLTRRGRGYIHAAREFALQLEGELAARVGKKRVEDLIATLRLLNG